MNTSALNNNPAMLLVNAQLSGDMGRVNIANAVAIKQAKVSKEVAQAAIQLLDAAVEIGANPAPARGIDVKA